MHVLCASICTSRHQDVPTRSRYVRLVDNVRDNGGNVRYDQMTMFSYYLAGSLLSGIRLMAFSCLAEYFQVFMYLANVSYTTTR